MSLYFMKGGDKWDDISFNFDKRESTFEKITSAVTEVTQLIKSGKFVKKVFHDWSVSEEVHDDVSETFRAAFALPACVLTMGFDLVEAMLKLSLTTVLSTSITDSSRRSQF